MRERGFGSKLRRTDLQALETRPTKLSSVVFRPSLVWLIVLLAPLSGCMVPIYSGDPPQQNTNTTSADNLAAPDPADDAPPVQR